MYFNPKLETVEARYTMNTPRGPKTVQVMIGKYKSIELHLGFLGMSGTNLNNINIYQGFRLLGLSDLDVIDQYIKLFVPAKYWNKALVILQLSRLEAIQISDDIEYIADIKKISSLERIKKETDIVKWFNDDMFPNILIENNPKYSNFLKMITLAQMTGRILEYMLGIRKLDDRDHWGNKRIESAARSMEQLFTALIKQLAEKTQTDIDADKTQQSRGLNAFKPNLEKGFILKTYTAAFAGDSWGVKGSTYKENITDSLKRESVISTYAQLTRINAPTSGYNGPAAIRLIHPTSTGYVCLAGDTDV